MNDKLKIIIDDWKAEYCLGKNSHIPAYDYPSQVYIELPGRIDQFKTPVALCQWQDQKIVRKMM